jgi:hypothetical protein
MSLKCGKGSMLLLAVLLLVLGADKAWSQRSLACSLDRPASTTVSASCSCCLHQQSCKCKCFDLIQA